MQNVNFCCKFNAMQFYHSRSFKRSSLLTVVIETFNIRTKVKTVNTVLPKYDTFSKDISKNTLGRVNLPNTTLINLIEEIEKMQIIKIFIQN